VFYRGLTPVFIKGLNFQMTSDSRFNEYTPFKPLIDFGLFRALSKKDV